MGFVKMSLRFFSVGTKVTSLEFERLNHVADEEVAALHVLHAVVVLRVVGDVACA